MEDGASRKHPREEQGRPKDKQRLRSPEAASDAGPGGAGTGTPAGDAALQGTGCTQKSESCEELLWKPPREAAQPCKPQAQHPPCTQGCSQPPKSICLSPSLGSHHAACSPSPSFKAASAFFSARFLLFKPDFPDGRTVPHGGQATRLKVTQGEAAAARDQQLGGELEPRPGDKGQPVQQPVPSRTWVLPHGDDTGGMVPISTHGCAPNAVPPIGVQG